MDKEHMSLPANVERPKSLKARLGQIVFEEKLNNVPGVLLLLFFSISFGAINSVYGMKAGLMIIFSMIGIAILYGIVAYPKFGIFILLVLAIFVFSLIRLGTNFPWGTAVDFVETLLILGFFISQKKKNNWEILKGPVSTMILIWVFFNFIEVANPTAESRLAWVYTIRSVAIVMLMYFVFVYQIDTLKFIRLIFKTWILLSFVGAAYAFKQEYIGFSAGDEEWLHSDPIIADLLFIGGHWRKFSIYSDPVVFSYHMAVSALLCFGLIAGNIKFWKKIVLACLSAIFIMAMLFSGTRGAYVLIPASLMLFSVLKFSRRIMIFSIVAFSAIGILIVIPTSNSTLYRFQSAFKPGEDDSFNARAINQKRIQPYIWSHPIGGGLGAVGTWGRRFAPNSYLAKFPPDSGYVRVAVELGWIGLFIFCCLMFSILKSGIDNYYLIKNPELKMYCFSLLLMIFAYNFGNYPQEALVQFPSNIYFCLAIALLNVVKRIDDEEQSKIVGSA